MAILLNKGTIEYIKVVVVDNNPTTAITDLSTHSPQYKVTDVPVTTDLVAFTAATVSLMVLYCLIDTTAAWAVVDGNYYLYVKFTVTPEIPVLGPIPFKVQ